MTPEWCDEFGPIQRVHPWADQEVAQHIHDLEYELATLPVPVDVMVAHAGHLPRPDRRHKLESRNSRLMALVTVRRAALARQQKRDKRLAAFRWMHARGWRPADIQNRLHLNTFEYDELLRETS